MTPRRLKQRVRSMLQRWERDLEVFEHEGLIATEDLCDPVSETHRNLASAIAYAVMILGTSDEGLRDTMDGVRAAALSKAAGV